MKAWSKIGLNKLVAVNCEIMSEKSEGKDILYWQSCIKFVKQIKELQYEQLSKQQKDWAVRIKLDLETEGF